MSLPLSDKITLPREHYFYVATAKHIFTHPNYGIVIVRDPIALKDALSYGLKPLILYGVTVAGTPINWLTFSPADKPRSFCSVLQEAWRTAPGLRGYPDILMVNRHVTDASPGLAAKLAQIGTQVVIADGNDKHFSSALRSAQGNARELSLYENRREVPITTLALLCKAAHSSHHSDQEFKHWASASKKSVVERSALWVALPVKTVDTDLPDEPAWAHGPWLTAWEASLPPSTARYFYDSTMDGTKWLLSGKGTNPDTEEFWDSEGEYDNAPEITKIMVSSWPNKPGEIAERAGITARQLQWFLAGRVQLSELERASLLPLLSIGINAYNEYEATGPCVLIAHAPRAIESAYEHLSHGGDIAESIEVLPAKGPADPSWRYLVFRACGGEPNIIMIPRGTAVAETINSKLFMNFHGQREVALAIYRDVVATCAKACVDPAANLAEMTRFAKRHPNGAFAELGGLWR